MKRVVKFKGKDIESGEWHYGSLMVYTDGRCEIVVFDDGEILEYEVDAESVGQFTGLTDKNGKDLYEGDVLRSNEYPYSDGDVKDNYYEVVLWEESTAAFISETRVSAHAHVRGISHGNCDYLGALFENGSNDFEILGNIHDNPELLYNGRD